VFLKVEEEKERDNNYGVASMKIDELLLPSIE
jgi:hypothetical protein